MPNKATTELPNGASELIALARVAHRNGDRRLERSAVNKLVHDFGISVQFRCEESVDRDLRRAEGRDYD
jgi:hypothetical protein